QLRSLFAGVSARDTGFDAKQRVCQAFALIELCLADSRFGPGVICGHCSISLKWPVLILRRWDDHVCERVGAGWVGDDLQHHDFSSMTRPPACCQTEGWQLYVG